MQLDESIVGSSSIGGGSERDLLRRRSSVGVRTKSSSGLSSSRSRRPGSTSSATSLRSRPAILRDQFEIMAFVLE